MGRCPHSHVPESIPRTAIRFQTISIHYGYKDGVDVFETINLISGNVSIVPFTVGIPNFGGFYNGRLIAAFNNNEIRSTDVLTGDSVIIATGNLDTVFSHDWFAVDP